MLLMQCRCTFIEMAAGLLGVLRFAQIVLAASPGQVSAISMLGLVCTTCLQACLCAGAVSLLVVLMSMLSCAAATHIERALQHNQPQCNCECS